MKSHFDPLARIRRGINRVLARERGAGRRPAPDAQETREREAAARAYAGENEQHFVDYLYDCVRTSVEACREIRRTQEECLRVFHEEAPRSYGQKEPWQARTVLPKPYATVMYGASEVKSAFSPEFVQITSERNAAGAAFWTAMFKRVFGLTEANFPLRFTDATIMGLAVGESMEMIPQFVGGRLSFSLVEPWKIHRDPDAPPRDPQGGLYWVHDEWLDRHVLLAGERDGRYSNVRAAWDVSEDSLDPFLTEAAVAARRKMLWHRSTFRKLVKVSEFWGEVLSPGGELLLSRATYTCAGGRVIGLPAAAPYARLRWPGVSFSPLPNLLGYGGTGLLHGVRSVWESMCQLMCLHEDALRWIVNPMLEINLDALDDPEDVDQWPGKRYLTRDTINGQQAVRAVQRRDNTASVLANLQFLDQSFQRGAMVTDAVQGLPGYRKDMTFRESQQNLSQARGVFKLMGANLEEGAVQAVLAAWDVIRTSAALADYQRILGPEQAAALGVVPDGAAPGGVWVPDLMSSEVSVSGIQQLMQDADTVATLREVVLPLAESPRFAPYILPFTALKALERRTGLKDEGVFLPQEQGRAVEQAQIAAMLAPPPAEDAGEPGGEGDEAGA